MKIMTVCPIEPHKLEKALKNADKTQSITLKGFWLTKDKDKNLSESTFYCLEDRHLLEAALQKNKPIILLSYRFLYKADILQSDAPFLADDISSNTMPISLKKIIDGIQWTGTQYEASLFQYTLKKIRY